MTCTARIETFHHTTRLLGVATAERCDISVRMVEPFPGRGDGRHIMYLLAGHVSYLVDGQLSDHGMLRARELLVDIFLRETRTAELCRTLARRGPRIGELVETARREIERELAPEAPIDDATFHRLRQALRRDLRAAGLDPRSYQRRYRALQQRRKAVHRGHELMLERIVERVARRLDLSPSRELLLALMRLDPGLPRCCTITVASVQRPESSAA